MNTVRAQAILFWGNWKLGFGLTILSLLLLVTPMVITARFGGNLWWFTLGAMLIGAATLAVITGCTQRELLSCGFAFLLPGLERAIARTQITIMAGLSVGALAVGLFFAGIAPLTGGGILPALALSVMTVMAYALGLLVIRVFSHASLLPTVMIFFYFAFIKIGKQTTVAPFADFFAHAGAVLAGCGLVLALALWSLQAGNLRRQLAGKPFLSPLDLYRPTKVQKFKNHSLAHQADTAPHRRPLQGILDRCLENTARARAAGRITRATLWETLDLGLTTGIPRRKRGLWAYVTMILVLTIITGYLDSWSSLRREVGMISWFSAFPFMFAILPLSIFHYLPHLNLGLIPSRQTIERAGYPLLGLLTLAALVGSVLILALFHLLGLVLPGLPVSGGSLPFLPPQNPHLPFLPVLVLPVVLMIYLLWRKPNSLFVFSGATIQVFIFFHAALNFGGYGWPLVVVLAISGGSWLALPYVWRRRMHTGSLTGS